MRLRRNRFTALVLVSEAAIVLLMVAIAVDPMQTWTYPILMGIIIFIFIINAI